MSIAGASRSFTYAPPKQTNRFKRLFSVSITHNYYTQNEGKCPDFRVTPTSSTSQILASLGMAFKDEGAGFSVFFQPQDLGNILKYLRHEAQDPGGRNGFWSRLTFLLSLTNAEFIGVTALPIQTTQSRANLFGCNLDAHRRDSGGPPDPVALLSQGDFMGAGALHPVVGNELNLTVPAETRRVIVTDISGAVVIPAPGTEPAALVSTGVDAPKRVSVDLSDLPYDLYTISLQGKDGEPIEAPTYPREVLYVPSDGESMVLLDMLFTQPTPESGGIYPIPPMFESDPPLSATGELAYRLPFDARHTYWQYYIVSQVPGSRLNDLRIDGSDARFEQDPKPVLLPDGSAAILFRTSDLLPLRQKSGQRFHLTGQRRDASGQNNAILVAPLPVAPGTPVWPGPVGESTTGTSEMFVYV
ncbi:MAG: hypothetical protein V4610_19870 [Pseudomonadota bacterium]|jgi:hypothetical protein